MTKPIFNDDITPAQLLPCPFCGGNAHWGTIRFGKNAVPKEDRDHINHFVGCDVCNAQTQTITGYKTQDEAATRWNTRVDNAAEIERLTAERDRFRRISTYQEAMEFISEVHEKALEDEGMGYRSI